jgi:RNA polymerase sigma-70 factor (ECF subfamily)
MQQEEFKRTVVPLRGALLAVSRKILGEGGEAEDAVQETLLKMWSMRGQLDQVDNMAGFAMRITRNNCLNRLRARRRTTGKTVDDTPTDTATPYRRLELRDSLDHTLRIIDTLPTVQQAVLRMRHIDGLEVDEIAELTGATAESVRVNLSRARRRVKERWLTISD